MIDFIIQARCDAQSMKMVLRKKFSWPILPRVGELVRIDENTDLSEVAQVRHHIGEENPYILVEVEVSESDLGTLSDTGKWEVR